MRKHILLFTLCTIGLCACQPHQTAQVDLNALAQDENISISSGSGPSTATAFVEESLADTARTVSQSMQRLASIESATHPHVAMPAPTDPQTIEMAQKASVDWTGPVEPLIKKVAEACHYKLHVLGQKPAVPALVKLNVKEQTLAQILRNLGYQIRHAANITVYPKRQIIELKYVTV